MKRLFYILTLALSMGAFSYAQEQAGVAAKMTLVNGKSVPVFLQSLADGRLVFQIYKRPNNIPLADISKVSDFEFLNGFDKDGVAQLFNTGEYQAVIDKMSAELKPSLDEYWQFMSVKNNFVTEFEYLIECYIQVDDLDNAAKVASAFMNSADSDVRVKGQSAAIRVALKKGEIEEAGRLLESVDSEVGKLYLQACVERAKEEPKAAFLLINKIISGHANDLAWMPQSELLNAHLYMDIGLTNSAINTAKQVKNIYANSSIAAEAQKLQTSLEEAKAKAEAESKARMEEEARQQAEVKARAEARAGITQDTDGDSEGQTDPQGGAVDTGDTATEMDSVPES